MDHVDLPLLSDDETVEAAIEQMNRYDRRFVLVRCKSGAFRSFSNKEVLQAWSHRVKTLRDVEGGEEVTVIEIAQVATAGSYATPLTIEDIATRPWHDPQREEIRGFMNAHGAKFGIFGSVASELAKGPVEVFTLREDIRDAARSKTKECICSKNSKHQGTSPPDKEPDCPFCTGTWQCA